MADERKFHAVPEESHATELLASERTFLAWIRTSVAVIGFGLAVIKFDAWVATVSPNGSQAGPRTPFSIGGLMILIGGILAALGAWHYRRTNKQKIKGQVSASNSLILIVAGIIILLSAFIIVYLVFLAEY
jgi:putative membrane protein